MPYTGEIEMRPANIDFAHRLLGPRSVYIILTPDGLGSWNAAPISNVTSVSVKPQIISIASYRWNRTTKLLKRFRSFVCCLMDASKLEAIWRSGGVYSGYQDIVGVKRFEPSGLKLIYPIGVKTPYVEGSLAAMNVRVVSRTRPGDHVVFFGRIISAYADPNAFQENEIFDAEKRSPILQITGNAFCEVAHQREIPYGPGKKV
jgi:flavin reductase (DIM6/NTAB) family NADH-FMN oxidoreductase RutF